MNYKFHGPNGNGFLIKNWGGTQIKIAIFCNM